MAPRYARSGAESPPGRGTLPQDRAGEAGRPAAALDPDVAARHLVHRGPGLAQALGGARVALEDHRLARGDRQDVGAEGVELLLGHVDRLDPALLEELPQPG